MYGKVFSSIFDGSLHGRFEATATMMVLVTLANRHGEVDMTVEALAARTGYPIDLLRAGIAQLQEPDPQSRTPGEDGRRIVPIAPHRNWGWRLVNHDKYRNIRSEEDRREYMRRYMQERRADEKEKAVSSSANEELGNANGKHPLAMLANADTDADTDAGAVGDGAATGSTSRARDGTSSLPACPVAEIVELYHSCMPDNPRIRVLGDDRRSAIRARWKQAAKLTCDPFGYDTRDAGLEAWREFFTVCATSEFLTGRAKPGKDREDPFIATLDFLMRPDVFARTLENSYHRRARR